MAENGVLREQIELLKAQKDALVKKNAGLYEDWSVLDQKVGMLEDDIENLKASLREAEDGLAFANQELGDCRNRNHELSDAVQSAYVTLRDAR